jgi:hypothetical protein
VWSHILYDNLCKFIYKLLNLKFKFNIKLTSILSSINNIPVNSSSIGINIGYFMMTCKVIQLNVIKIMYIIAHKVMWHGKYIYTHMHTYIHYNVPNSLSMYPILSQTRQVHILTSYYFKIHVNMYYSFTYV